jgi:amyotrophic lateral sclerosis 2 protein
MKVMSVFLIYSSFTVVFPDESATITCQSLEGKERLLWNLVTAIMNMMNFDLISPRTRNIENALQDLKTRDGIAYTFKDKSHPFYESKYNGRWHKGKPLGQGELASKDGTYYKGDFFNGLFHGNGQLNFKADPQSEAPLPLEYHGDFEKGLYHGYGDMKYANGDIYEGWWKDGNRHGYGRYEERRKDKRAVYFGGWENNKRSGYGVGEDKVKLQRYMGMWSNDVYHGFGILILSDGTYCETKFSHGEIEEGEDGYILSPTKSSFEGKIGPNLKLCGKGNLAVYEGSKMLSCVSGTFSGEWGKSISIKHGEVHGLFQKPDQQVLRPRAESMLPSVDRRIGFCSVKASEKWKPLVEIYKLKMGFTESGKRQSVPFNPHGLVQSMRTSPPPSIEDNERRLTSSEGEGDGKVGTPARIERALFNDDDPLCHLMNKLAAVYHESYSGLGTSKVLLPHAINEAKEMIRQMHALIRCLYPHLCGDQRLLGPYGTLHSGKEDRHNDWVDIDSGYAIIQPLVFERIFPTLFSLYVLHNEEQDSKYKRGIRILNKLDDVQLAKNLSMSTEMIDDISAGGEDSRLLQMLAKCAKSLEAIKAIFTPTKILQQFQVVFGTISDFSQNAGMDIMLPISIMAVVRAKFPRLGAYVHFLFDFVTEQSQVPNTEEGYIMTTFESIYSAITLEAERWPSSVNEDT